MVFNFKVEITPPMIKAAWVTIIISARSLFFWILCRVGLVFLQSFRFAPIRWFARGYISVIRGTPYFSNCYLVFLLGGA